MSKQKRADEGGRPWCIQPELVEGCTRICSFCGLNAIRDAPGNFKYMTVDIARKMAEEMSTFCPTARIEFAMRGEPLVNPKHLDIFRVFRENCPKAQMMVTTNGDTLRNRMQERMELMFDAGLNFVLLDTYYPEPGRTALREEAIALKGIGVEDYFDDWAPEGDSPYHNHGQKLQRLVVLMDDLEARDGEHSSRQVKSHAGSNPTKIVTEPLKRNCGRPFREMTIAWNGDFTLCCDDWMKQYVVGNVVTETLQELWVHPRIEAARARLMAKDRDFGPCRACDAPMAPRTGLLPVYGRVTEADMELTAQVTQEGSVKVPLWKTQS